MDENESVVVPHEEDIRWWKQAWRKISATTINVEIIIFVLSYCNTVRGVVKPALSEAKMRRTYPAPPDMSKSALKKYYNSKMVLWDQNYQYINLPIACISGLVFGAYSDYRGRKLPLLIGMASVFIDNAVYMLVWSDATDIPLQWLFLSAAVVGLLGDFMLLMSCVNSYLVDEYGDKKHLGVRMIIVSTVFSLGALCGSQTVHHVADKIGNFKVLYIVQGTIIATFLFALWLLKNPIPKRNDEESLITDAPSVQVTLYEAVVAKFKYVKNAFKIFYTSREGHRRGFLYASFGANFLDQLVFGEEKDLLGKYTRLDPFNWDTDEYSKYKSIRPITQIAGMIFGLVVLKKALKIRDTSIITMTIAAMGVCCLLIGLAQSSTLIYVSLAPDALHGLLNPLTYTFISCLVNPDEIGQTFAISTIAGKVAGLIQSAILDNVYRATLQWYQGFVWLLMSAISMIASLVYLWVHVIAKRESIGA
uniref:MFS domain-containing protein n=1 Tax=Panagrellus redivivus TaxID=6233 RepID=A0A7E4UYC1_PANRE